MTRSPIIDTSVRAGGCGCRGTKFVTNLASAQTDNYRALQQGFGHGGFPSPHGPGPVPFPPGPGPFPPGPFPGRGLSRRGRFQGRELLPGLCGF